IGRDLPAAPTAQDCDRTDLLKERAPAMSLNLAGIVRSGLRYHPDATALIAGERRTTYAELARAVSAFAAHLRALGVRPGDRVALLACNSPSFTTAYFGILHAGCVVVPVSFLSVGREVGYSLRDSGAVALVAGANLESAAREGFEQADDCAHLLLFDESQGPLTLVDSQPVDWSSSIDLAPSRPDDTAVILYTSGTTGEPKGAELTHFNLYSNADLASSRLLSTPTQRRALGPGDVTLAALPLFHSFGQTSIQNATVFGGAAMTYMERFEPGLALEIMERERVTVFAGVPTMYFALLEHANAERVDLSALEFCFSGGAAMPVEVMRAFESRYGVAILEGYGLSETSPIATFNVLFKERKPGSIGEAVYGCEVRIVDEEDREVP